jgi:hypothetical protein
MLHRMAQFCNWPFSEGAARLIEVRSGFRGGRFGAEATLVPDSADPKRARSSAAPILNSLRAQPMRERKQLALLPA